MNKKYFFLFFISTLSNCYSLLAQSTVAINPLTCSTNSEAHIYMLSSERTSVPIGSPCFPADVKSNGAEGATGVADTLRFIKMEVYLGKDSTFVKDQSMSIGSARFPGIKNQIGGLVIYFGYKFHKNGGKPLVVVGGIHLMSYPVPAGIDPITVLSSASDVSGAKIALSFGAIDIISWDGKPWGAPTTIYATYDTSNGKYSIQINQWRPVTQ